MSGMADLPDVPDRIPQLRASDADRERVAEILRRAAAEGRLSLDELDERLSAVYAAKTYADLVPVTHDLPVAGTGIPVPMVDNRIGGHPTSRGGVAILGGFSRKGPWVVPELFTAVAFWGGAQLDLREARFETAEVELRLFAVMGGFEVILPEEAEVIVSGVGIMGGFDDRAAGPAQMVGNGASLRSPSATRSSPITMQHGWTMPALVTYAASHGHVHRPPDGVADRCGSRSWSPCASAAVRARPNASAAAARSGPVHSASAAV